MRKLRITIMVILLLILSNVLIFIPPDDISPLGRTSAAAPPAIEDVTTYWDGHWFVDSNATYQNQTIIVNGNLIVKEGYSLTLINVTLKMNGTGNLSRFIQVNNTGSLYIQDYDGDPFTIQDASNITSNHTDGQHRFGLNVTQGANFSIVNSELSELGRPSGIASDWGLYIRGNNAIVRNCRIYNCYAGIVVSSCSGTSIENNTFSNIISYGMYLPWASDLYIYNNTLDLIYDNSDGIWITSGQRNRMVGNSITCYGTLSYCIFLSPSCKWTDIISNYLNCTTTNSRAIYVQSDYVNITSNTVICWDSTYSIDLQNVNWINLTDNIIQGEDVIAVIGVDGSHNITIRGGSITGIDCRTILVENGASDITFDDVHFANAATTQEIIGFIGARNILLVNCTFNAQDEDMYLYGNSKVIIRNTPINTVGFSDALSNLTEQHYLDVIVVDRYGDPISGANVQIKNKTNYVEFNGPTDTNGRIQYITLTGAVHDQSTTELHTPHNITISAAGYQTWYSDPIIDKTKLLHIILLKPDESPIIQYSSDWNVVGYEEYWNQTFLMDGNITVFNGGSLILNNCTVLMNCTQADGQYHISVHNGGTLRILDYDWDNSTTFDESLISDSPFDLDDGSILDFAYNFTNDQGALLEIRNSSIRDCGWLPDPAQPWVEMWRQGVWIDADDAVLDHVNITSRNKGIIISWTSDVMVANCSININATETGAMGILTYDSFRTLLMNNSINMSGIGTDQTGISLDNNIDTYTFGNYVNMHSANGWADGINIVNGGASNYIIENTVDLNIDGSGIILWGANGATVAFNNIHTYFGYSSAIHIGGSGATNCNIQYNNIIVDGIGRGFNIQNDCQNTIINGNTILGAGDYVEAIAVDNAYNNFTISNSIANLTGMYSTGLWCYGSSYFNVYSLDVTILDMYSNGISISNCANVNIGEANISSSSGADDTFGSWVEHSQNIMISDLSANMQNDGGTGMWFYDGAVNCFVIGANISTNGIANEALVGFNCSSVVIINSTLSALLQDDIVLASGAVVALINSTYSDLTVVDPASSLFVFWYLHIRVVDEFSQPFSDVNVQVERADSTVVYNGVTDSNGWVKWIICMGFMNSSTAKDNSSNPYLINASNATCWDELTMDLTDAGQSVVVMLGNEDPIITNPQTNIQILEDSIGNWDFDAIDNELNPIAWSINTSSGWVSLDPLTGELSLAPNETAVGKHYFKIRATDINNGYNEFNILITVTNRAPVIQTANLLTITEDSLYIVDYASDDDPATTWALVGGPSWLSMDADSGVLSGTPNNTHVGDWDINVSVEDGSGGITWNNFSLTVNNNPPSILTGNVESAIEDQLYSVDYASTDDDQGAISWSMNTGPSWLTIDPLTGVLSGTPTNDHVRQWSITIKVSDGNGGTDQVSFKITVINTPPVILSSDVISIDEDSLYEVSYSSSDDGFGIMSWILTTNADAWLSLDEDTGILSGTPLNEHVGSYWLNVTVHDDHGGFSWHNFTLTVSNTNDAPVILTKDVIFATEDQLYLVDYQSSDDDGDTVSWSLTSEADWLKLDTDSSTLSGTPTNLDVGIWEVTISCDDGLGGITSQSFNLTVLNVNDAPVIDKYSPVDSYPEVEEGKTLEFNVTYSDEDSSVFTIIWTLDGKIAREDVPFWTYIPEFSTAGDHEIIINISDDGSASITNRWIVIVTTANRAPVINEFIPPNLKPIFEPATSTMSFSINATDPDSDQLTYEWYLDDEDTGERTSSYVIDRLRISPGTYNLTVLVTDSEGNYIEHTWNLNVEPEGSKKSESSESGIGIIIAVVIIIIILIILLVLLVLRKKRTYGEIEDIFVISRAGLLLAHKSKEIRPDMDDDILSGMLTAIQDFVKDAFGEKSKFGLKRLDFGDSEIRLKRGNGYFIAVVFTGTEPANLEANLDKTIVNLEDKYGNVLETWAGNRSQLRGIKDQLDDLLK